MNIEHQGYKAEDEQSKLNSSAYTLYKHFDLDNAGTRSVEHCKLHSAAFLDFLNLNFMSILFKTLK